MAQPPHFAQPAAKQGPKKGLVIAIGAVVVIGGVIGIVLAVKSGGSGGASSSDALAKSTLVAMASADVDSLVGLVGPEDMMSKALDCPKDTDPPDPKEVRAAQRRDLEKRVEGTKGLKLDLVEITEDHEDSKRAGEKVGDCTLKLTTTLHRVKAKVTVQQGDKPAKDQNVRLDFIEIGGRFYLEDAPNIKAGADCASAIAAQMKVGRDKLSRDISASTLARMEKKMVEHCNDDSWPDDAIDCLAEASPDIGEKCMKKLSASQSDKVMKDVTALIEQDIKVKAPPIPPPIAPQEPTVTTTDAGADPATSPVVESTGTEFPAICEDWEKQVDQLQTCSKLPAASRKSLKDSVGILRNTFNTMKTMTPAMRETFETTCKRGIEAVLEIRKLCR